MALVYRAEPLPGDRQVRDTDLTTRRGQIRHLMQTQGMTGPQAKALLAEQDARRASATEFGAAQRRRGDLIRVRGKARHPWAVTSR